MYEVTIMCRIKDLGVIQNIQEFYPPGSAGTELGYKTLLEPVAGK